MHGACTGSRPDRCRPRHDGTVPGARPVPAAGRWLRLPGTGRRQQGRGTTGLIGWMRHGPAGQHKNARFGRPQRDARHVRLAFGARHDGARSTLSSPTLVRSEVGQAAVLGERPTSR
jgi:hypothetical protein